MQTATTPRSFPVRQRVSHIGGSFDPTKYRNNPEEALKTILPFEDSMMDVETYEHLLASTRAPTTPTISTEAIGTEESKG